jgi:enoyl-CoA hydratase/carnithine racemase
MNMTISWNDQRTVATITLDRARVHNALDAALLEAIEAGAREADREGARIIVLRGAGPSFCSGADRKNYPGYRSDEDREAFVQHAIQIGNRACSALARTNALTLARLHGHVLGGGLALALACDLRFVASEATLALPEVQLSVPLGWGALYRLISAVGTTRAWEMLIAGRHLGGEESVAWGLCNASVPEAELDALVERRVASILALDSRALMLTKLQFRALAARSTLGDLEQFDGAMLLSALEGRATSGAFRT